MAPWSVARNGEVRYGRHGTVGLVWLVLVRLAGKAQWGVVGKLMFGVEL